MKKHTKPMTGQDIRVRADDAHEFLLGAWVSSQLPCSFLE